MSFKALWVTETRDGKFERNIVEREFGDLPEGDVLVKVHYSALNYKDALSATGNKGITRKYPHTPGIDAAGVVELSSDEHFVSGESVIVTGHDLGMNTCGAFAEYIRVPGSWVLPKPDNLSLKESMIIGTAGFTAASALYKMELMGQRPDKGPIVVTGATGGVGSLAVAILAKAGYEVIAVSGKTSADDYLTFLGAASIEKRDFVRDVSGKNLIRPKWAGAIDTTGGDILVTLLKGCYPEGNVVSTGLVNSPKLDLTVFPFILNGVSLLGVGSAETPYDTRRLVWEKLSGQWFIQDKLAAIAKEVSLQELSDTYIDSILHGQIIGRIVVSMK